jgi:hypothetical protein
VLSRHTIADTAAEFQALYERIATRSSQEVGLAAASAAT